MIEIDVLRLDGAPEELYPDIVLASSTPVHADLDTILLTDREPQLARVLATLIEVDNLWCSWRSLRTTFLWFPS